MLKKFLKALIIIPVSLVLIALAVGNRHMVRMALDPFTPDNPIIALDAPFFVYLFGALLVGILLGGIAAWMGQSKWRKAARQRSHEAMEWRKEAERLSREISRRPTDVLPAP